MIEIIVPTIKISRGFDTLCSLQVQTLKEWHCSFIHSDNIISVTNESAVDDSRITSLYSTYLSAPSKRNLGLEEMNCEYVVFLDSDDLLAPWALEDRVKFMDSNPELDFALFPALEFNHRVGDLNTLRSSINSNRELLNFLSFQTAFQTSCPIWRREALEKIGGWNEKALSWQDGELHIRALLKGLEYAWGSDMPDVFLRLKGEDKITSKAYDPIYVKNRYEVYAEIAAQLPGHLRDLFQSNISGLTWNLIENELSRKDIDEVIDYAIQENIIDKSDQLATKAYVKVWYLSKQVPGLRGLVYRLRPLFKKRRSFFSKEELSKEKKRELIDKLRTYPTFHEKFAVDN